MNPLTLSQIAQFAGASLSSGDGAVMIDKVGTDSRTIKPGELFVALRGENFDGHDFVEAVATSGATGALVDHKWNGQCSGKFCAHPSGRYAARLSNDCCKLSAIAWAESPSDHRKQRKNEHKRFRRVGSRQKISRHQDRRQFQQSRWFAAHNS